MSDGAAVIAADETLDLLSWMPPVFEPGDFSDDGTPQRLELRDYQRDAVARTWRMFHEENFGKLLGVAATGSGKTVIFSELCKLARAAGGRALVLVDQEELVDQAVARMRDTTGIVADVEQASRHASVDSDVVVSTVQSMRRRLDKYPRD